MKITFLENSQNNVKSETLPSQKGQDQRMQHSEGLGQIVFNETDTGMDSLVFMSPTSIGKQV